ncbi:MAG: glycosyltransferase [Deltaproteobacteria bacterium]|nr:glycosyltransferase [Deltaproteobacteria bacterium]
MESSSGSSRPNVLFLTNGYPDYPGSFRGHFVRRMAQGVTSRGYRVFVVTPKVYPESRLFEIDSGNIGVFRFPYPSGGRQLIQTSSVPVAAMVIYLANALLMSYRVARKHPFVLIHVHWVIPMGLVGECLSRALGIPMLVHAMGSDIHTYAIRNRILAALTRHVLRHTDAAAAVSRDLDDRMNALAPGLPPAHVIPNGIDVQAFRPGDRHDARKKLGLPVEATYLLFVGGLIPVKGIDLLQQALSPLLRERPDLRLIMAGDGPLRSEVETWAGRTAPGRVHLLGGVAHESMPTVYRAANVFILPSRNEGLPNALLEAMASGLPCVASPVGDIPRVIRHGGNGLLMGSQDASELRKQVLRVLDDRIEAAHLADRAFESVQAFSEQISFDRVVRLYETLGKRR